MIYTSPFPEPSIPIDVSFSQFITRTNPDDVSPDRVIASDFDNPGHSITYGELRKRASQGAATLRNTCGISESDVVCLYGQNSVNWMLLCHCVMWSGGCFCAINPFATPYELQHYFEIAQPTVIAVDGSMVPRVEKALQSVQLPRTPRIVVIEDGVHQTYSHLPKFPKDFIRFQNRSVAPYDLTGRDNRKAPAGMCFSSGTSGKPKAVVLSHHNLIAYMIGVRTTNPFIHSAHMREVFFPPFAHIYGLVAAVLLTSYVGNYVVAMKNFDFMAYLGRCAEIRATVLRLVPALAVRMTKDPAVRQLNLKSIHTMMVSGASLSTETVKDLQKILDPDASVINGYGMTECSISMLRETQSHRAGSLGKPVAGVKIRIVDNDHNDVAEGQDGECLVKAATVFMEYKGNPEETAGTFYDGWLCTGDIVRRDDDGYLWMTGRKKELIKYKGNQVPPAELESVLLSHPHVDEAGVVGIYDEKQETEVPVGAVVLAPTVKDEHIHTTLADIKRHVDERVAPYKRLRGGLFHLPELPKGSTGKLVRREIPAKLAEHAKKQAPQPKL